MTDRERAALNAWITRDPDWHDLEILHCEVCPNPNRTCQTCGEPLPELDNGEIGYCPNCCECDSCCDAYQRIEEIHRKTGHWHDMPIVTGEKVYTHRDSQR